ncbi:hypothetical protein MMC06_006839 [Schaereria dolodes]|nr:hypothetical protein [Schaereria dolodes]
MFTAFPTILETIRLKRFHARIIDWARKVEGTYDVEYLDRLDTPNTKSTTSKVKCQERFLTKYSVSLIEAGEMGEDKSIYIGKQVENADSNESTSLISQSSLEDNIESQPSTPITPVSPQLQSFFLSDNHEHKASILVQALALAPVDGSNVGNVEDFDLLAQSQSIAFAKGINLELRNQNLVSWLDHFHENAGSFDTFEEVLLHDDDNAEADIEDFGDDVLSREQSEGILLRNDAVSNASSAITDTEEADIEDHADVGAIIDVNFHNTTIAGQTYAEEANLEYRAEKNDLADVTHQGTTTTKQADIEYNNQNEVSTSASPPDLRRYIPQGIHDVLERIFWVFPPVLPNGLCGKACAHGVADYYYMSQATHAAQTSCSYTPPRLQPADRSVDCFWSAKDKCGNLLYDPREYSTISRSKEAELTEQPLYHHLSFNKDKVYYKSATPPEESLWAAFASTLPPKASFHGPTRQRVLASQASKLIDPFHYSGPKEYLNLRGTELRNAVKDHVQVVYDPSGTWEYDRYENDETFPRSTYEFSCYDSNCGFGIIPIYTVTTEHDGDTCVNDDGRSHSVLKNPKRTFQHSPSKLSLIQNIYDKNAEDVADTLSSSVELLVADVDHDNTSRPSTLLCEQGEQSIESEGSSAYQNTLDGSQEQEVNTCQDYFTPAQDKKSVISLDPGVSKDTIIDNEVYSSFNNLSEQAQPNPPLFDRIQELANIVSQPEEGTLDNFNSQIVDEFKTEEQTLLPEVGNEEVDGEGIEEAAISTMASMKQDSVRPGIIETGSATMGDVVLKSLWEYSESPQRLRRLGLTTIIEDGGISDQALDKITFIPYIKGWSQAEYLANYEYYWKYSSYEKVGCDSEADEDSMVESPMREAISNISSNELESGQKLNGSYSCHGYERPLANTSMTKATPKPFAISQAEVEAVFSNASTNNEYDNIRPICMLSPIIEAPEVDQELLADALYEPNTACTSISFLLKTSYISHSSKQLAPLLDRVLSPIQELPDVEEEVVSVPNESSKALITNKGESLDTPKKNSPELPPVPSMVSPTRPSKRQDLIARSRILSHLKEVHGNFLQPTKTQPGAPNIKQELKAEQQSTGKWIMRSRSGKEPYLPHVAFALNKSVLKTSSTPEDDLLNQRDDVSKTSSSINHHQGFFEIIATSIGEKVLRLKNSWSLPRNIAW